MVSEYRIVKVEETGNDHPGMSGVTGENNEKYQSVQSIPRQRFECGTF
jgi:hypothetical protein